MKKNYYYLTHVNRSDYTEAGRNKRDAIRQARELAAKEKCSIELFKCVGDKTSNDLLVAYVGILEFPYYLRDLNLTAADITVNLAGA